jgi:hypothetical protein
METGNWLTFDRSQKTTQIDESLGLENRQESSIGFLFSMHGSFRFPSFSIHFSCYGGLQTQRRSEIFMRRTGTEYLNFKFPSNLSEILRSAYKVPIRFL